MNGCSKLSVLRCDGEDPLLALAETGHQTTSRAEVSDESHRTGQQLLSDNELGQLVVGIARVVGGEVWLLSSLGYTKQ